MTTFKVMTWNLENLFRPGSESGPKSQTEFAQKLNSLADVILKLDPDVLAVQEVGGTEPFNDLAAQLQGRYRHLRLSNQPDGRGIRVGFLSKLPIEESEDIVDFPLTGLPSVSGIDSKGNFVNVTRLGRGALRIRVKPKPDFPVHLIAAHLKSKLLTFPSQSGSARFTTNDEDERARIAGIALLQRTAEAVALRVKANELKKRHPDDGLIVLGDLNDVTDAATTQILQGPPGNEIGTNAFNKPDRGDEVRLFNLAPLIPQQRRFSRIFKGNGELIDHILVSEELLPGRPRRLPEVDSHVDAVGSVPSIGDEPNKRRGEPGSDHAPVTARFEL
jgi:endonuclease/exonuclease/phosphatase family metal-dependent hydrolase